MDTTDANGMVTFNNLLTSSEYDLIVEGYRIFGSTDNIADNTDFGSIDDENLINGNFSTYVYQGYAANDYMANLGNVMVSPIINGDEIDPLVATVLNQYGMAGTDIPGQGNRGVLMLQRTVTDTIEIMFTEAVVGDDLAQNVMVVSKNKDGGNTGFLDVSSVDLTGNKLTVTLTNDLVDGQRFAVLLFRDTNMRDLAGNPLSFRNNQWNPEAADEGTYSPWIDLEAGECVDGICQDASLRYLSCDVNGRAFEFDFMAYQELKLDAEGPSAIAQMELDTDVVRTVDSDVSDLEMYSNAFNNIAPDTLDIDLPGHPSGPLDSTFATLQFNNVSGAFEPMWRLTELKQALTGNSGPHMDFVYTDAARIKFTAGKATVYEVTVPKGINCDTGNKDLGYIVTEGSCINDVAGTSKYLVSGFAEGDEIDIVLVGDAFDIIGDELKHGDQVVITPVNDLCIPGTAGTVVLQDNVAPTTVLQNSYIGGTVADGISQIVPFGEGGELANVYGVQSGMGLPALYITPGLLDNLDGSGNNILEANQFVAADETLEQELYIHNIADNNYTVADKIYDATDWDIFATMLTRNVGVSFSENVDLTGVTPEFSGASVSGYTVANNIGKDDADHNVSRDLVVFETSDVLRLANVESDAIMSFNGIKDLAGNAADHAYVKVLDGMPPFVTRAIFDGENAVITFNEPISLELSTNVTGPELDFGPIVRIENSVARYQDNPTDWSLDSTGTILTIATSAFDRTPFSLDASVFSEQHQYDEADEYALAAGDYKHARLYTNTIEDLNGNSWLTWYQKDQDVGPDNIAIDMSTPGYPDLDISNREVIGFAMISAIGDFEVTVNNAGFIDSDDNTTVQTITWTFNQAVRTGTGDGTNPGDDFFTTVGSVRSEANGDTALINQWFEYSNGGTNDLADHVTNARFELDTTGKIITLTFTGPAADVDALDVIRTQTGQVFVSDVDDTQNEGLIASANEAP